MDLGTRYIPCKKVNIPLPVVGIQVDDVQCSALVETRYSWSIISAHCCQLWGKEHVDVVTIGSVSSACYGAGVVTIHTKQGTLAEVSILVVQENILAMICCLWSILYTYYTSWRCAAERKNLVQQFLFTNMTSVLLLTTVRKPGLWGGSGPWIKYQSPSNIRFQNMQYWARSRLHMKSSYKHRLLKAGWYHTSRND